MTWLRCRRGNEVSREHENTKPQIEKAENTHLTVTRATRSASANHGRECSMGATRLSASALKALKGQTKNIRTAETEKGFQRAVHTQGGTKQSAEETRTIELLKDGQNKKKMSKAHSPRTFCQTFEQIREIPYRPIRKLAILRRNTADQTNERERHKQTNFHSSR